MTPQDPQQQPQGQPVPPRPQPNQSGQPQPNPQGQPPMPPTQGQPQPGQNRPDYQWQPAQNPGAASAGSSGTTTTTAKPGLDLGGLWAAFKPEPAKAPPLEWVGLVVSLVLLVCGFLPWINVSSGGSVSGLDIGDGWIVMGAGLMAAILGFIGLSRDSIALAAGQALLGLIALGFAIVNLTGLTSGESAAFGLILTIVVALIVIGLGVYNAIDARRKGAKY